MKWALLALSILTIPLGLKAQTSGSSFEGVVPVLLYHHIGDEEGRWTRTPEGFRRDLELLHERGFRPVSILEMVQGSLDVSESTKPVVIVFDDASPNQFKWLDDKITPDPTTAVGILEFFSAENPEWKGGATFCLLSAARGGNAFFGDRRTGVSDEDRRNKILFLYENGYELCNHSWWHGRLDKMSAAQAREQIARGMIAIDSIIPGEGGKVFALPLGMWPQDKDIAIKGEWVSPEGDTIIWNHQAVLLAGSDLSVGPAHPDFNPHAIQRVQVIGDNLSSILDRVDRRLERARRSRK